MGEPETCEHCGGPLVSNRALANVEGSCVVVQLPAHCPSEECRRQRDEAAITDAIARGLINP